ncbi:unnamed protein product [Cunninghamella blakesleeana]
MSSQLCLDQLLNNKKTSSLIVINDSIQFSALPLLIEFSQRALDTYPSHQVIAILTETSPSIYLQQFQNTKQLHIIDAYTDPYGWEKNENEAQPFYNCADFDHIHNINDFEKYILSNVIEWIKKSPNTTIIIDSLNPFSQISTYRTYQFLKAIESLTTETIRAIIGYHMDIRPIPDNNNSSTILLQQLPPFIDSLNRLASVNIILEALKGTTAQSENQARLTGFVVQDSFSYLTTTSNHIYRGGLAKIQWRRKSGKVSYETNGFYLDINKKMMIVSPSYFGIENESDMDDDDDNKKKNDKDKDNNNNTPDPTANLSFNLTLTDEQRKTKEKLVLPYLKAQQIEIDDNSSTTTSSTTSSGGAIFYEPDAADDFDDEDPDEDLDI